jgi:hypothetical protein
MGSDRVVGEEDGRKEEIGVKGLGGFGDGTGGAGNVDVDSMRLSHAS